MIAAIQGASAMGALVAALFFLKFWTQTRDRFFILFSIAFGVDGLTRTLIALEQLPNEHEPLYYGARLITFGLILVAIIDKNRKWLGLPPAS
ncbi:MAG TPA: DUF5985 family protein [Hyphomicrobiaceae bacterium]|nr:DUF5985 family protein [Hyphomicrobiaceae bacterium]